MKYSITTTHDKNIDIDGWGSLEICIIEVVSFDGVVIEMDCILLQPFRPIESLIAEAVEIAHGAIHFVLAALLISVFVAFLFPCLTPRHAVFVCWRLSAVSSRSTTHGWSPTSLVF